MANLDRESKLNAGAVGDSGQAYGIAQRHLTRRAQILAGMGHSVVGSSFEDQVRMGDWELRNPERAAGNRLRQTTTAAEAGDAASRYYERPLNVDTEASIRAGAAAALGRRWQADPPHQGGDSGGAADTLSRRPQTPAELFGFPFQNGLTNLANPPAGKSEGSTHSITVDFNGMPHGATVRIRRSCPTVWCSSGATGQRWAADQAASAGKLTSRSSLSGAMVSSAM